MLFERALEERRPLPEKRSPQALGSSADNGDRLRFLPVFERPFGKAGDGVLVKGGRSLTDHSPEVPEPSASIKARTASRSSGLRSGCQTSKMKTTRSWSEGFIASCSTVSSK